jgi:hypothetical protein
MRQTSLALLTLACAASLSLGACLRADAPPAAGEGDDGVKTPSQGWGELPADHEVGDELGEGVSPSEATSAAGDCSQRWSLPSEVSNAGLAQRVPYAGADECSGGATQGARQLGNDLRERFTDSINLDVEGDGVQIYACRNINGGSGLSVHATGRAIDLFIPTDGGAADNALGDVVAHWLVRNAELVGVQLLIWDRTIWKPGEGDRCYGGAHPHNDHIHIELSEAAGDLRTPYFQGEPAPQDPDPQDPDPQDPNPQDPDPQDPPDPVDPDPQDLSPIPGAWVGTPCVADSQCGFTHEGVRARCYLERNPSFGVCTLPCEGFCPDRQGHAVTFCASNDDLQGRSDAGFCMARAEDSNGFCFGMSRVSAARWVGASGAPSAQREVCAPNLGQGDPQDPVDPGPQGPLGSLAAAYEGIDHGGLSIPREGLRNPTLQGALGVAVEPYGEQTQWGGRTYVRGTVSWFGGPNDTGVTAEETGAITGERLRSLNSPLDPSSATLAARPEDYYFIAMRWDYTPRGRAAWVNARLVLVNPDTGAAVVVRPVDWGPNTRTGRAFDLSPQALDDLNLSTDGEALAAFVSDDTPLGPISTQGGGADPQDPDPVDPGPQDGIWRPSPTATWQIQYSGDSLDTSPNVQVFNLDLFDTEQGVIDGLKRRGVAVVCYFSAGSSEDWRPDFASFPAAALGQPLDGWAGERWLDIRSSQIRQIMTRRLDLAAQKNCDAVDPDNVNGWDNDTGFNLSPADQLDFNRFLAREAHARGLSIGLKNDQDQAAELVDHFDWALNEECIAQNNCTPYLTTFVAQGKAVFNVEYEGSASRVCDISNLIGLNTLLKTLDLGPERTACR